MSNEENSENVPTLAKGEESADLSLDINSVAVRRLIEEVRSSDSLVASAHYNRTYNRHNR